MDKIVVIVPPEPTSVRQTCCENCPSQPGFELDPEAAAVLEKCDPAELKPFACAWTPGHYCKGWADRVAERSAEVFQPLDQFAEGDRTTVVDNPDKDCAYPIVWGSGRVVRVGRVRSEVKFDSGDGGMFPNRLLCREVT